MPFASLRLAKNDSYRFHHKVFVGVECRDVIAFDRHDPIQFELGYTDADLDRVEFPEPCLHVGTYYAMRAGKHAPGSDAYNALADTCMSYIAKACGEINRTVL